MSHTVNDKIIDQIRDLYEVEGKLMARKEHLLKKQFAIDCELQEVENTLKELAKEIRKLRSDVF